MTKSCNTLCTITLYISKKNIINDCKSQDLEKLKKRWGIHSNFQIIIILIVFSITGSSSLFVGKPILDFFNITNEMSWYFYWPLRLIVIFPAYQVLLLLYGWLLGQFTFFWNFEKRMLSHMGLKFLFKNENERAL